MSDTALQPDVETTIKIFAEQLGEMDEAPPCAGKAGAPCDQVATYAARFSFPCDHLTLFLMCEKHAQEYIEAAEQGFVCYMCKCLGTRTLGKVVRVWRI